MNKKNAVYYKLDPIFFYPSFESFTLLGGGWFVFDSLVDFVFWLPGMLGVKFVVETLSETKKTHFF